MITWFEVLKNWRIEWDALQNRRRVGYPIWPDYWPSKRRTANAAIVVGIGLVALGWASDERDVWLVTIGAMLSAFALLNRPKD